ncbi:HAD family hydrolase [Klugiella xanthotipulae]|uniref:HAD superfamily hydrolase (TIGR01509 family) n=1 Tax=Klugiella xanthotipulae TaxID=244735 RepID=A0A543HST7_9MICO|nr:HAD family phosphatase [Klugiella xanthotipulae]TQM61408.1 HAD superfamily hydrolase (TIGR01509 family) [Klugiella xanthotipulae]
MNTLLPAAVLWDMDGTLVDTEPLWYRAEDRLAELHNTGISPEVRAQLTGMGLWEAARLIQSCGVELDEDGIVEFLTAEVARLIKPDNMPWRPGALELLSQLNEVGIPTALVTMSTRSLTNRILEFLPFNNGFSLVVSGDEVPHPKPHPAPYQIAAQQLGVEIEHCVIFEDSITGLRSAFLSGGVAIGIPHLMALDATDHHALWETLVGRTITDIFYEFSVARRDTTNQEVTA